MIYNIPPTNKQTNRIYKLKVKIVLEILYRLQIKKLVKIVGYNKVCSEQQS